MYIMDIDSNLDQIIALEQHFIDTLNPSLNVDIVAGSSGYHEAMAQNIRERLRKERGTPVYIYDVENFNLLYVFISKQDM